MRPVATISSNLATLSGNTSSLRSSIEDPNHQMTSIKTTMDIDCEQRYRNKSRIYIKKSKNLFTSQLHFMFHLAFTVCLLRISATRDNHRTSYNLFISYYYGYLLGTSIFFILFMRCWRSDIVTNTTEKSEINSVLFGSIALGLIQLIKIGLDVASCTYDFMFLPVFHFIFTFQLMHFILTFAQHGSLYSYNNIALGHLLSCQISLWLINFDPLYGNCGYRTTKNYINRPLFYFNAFTSVSSSPSSSFLTSSTPLSSLFISSSNLSTSTLSPSSSILLSSASIVSSLSSTPISVLSTSSLISNNSNNLLQNLRKKKLLFPASLNDILLPIVHNYQLLMCFIFFIIWLKNNNIRGYIYSNTRNVLDETNASYNFMKRSNSVKGLFIGILTISTALIVLLLGDEEIAIITHTCIQSVSAMASLVGLIVSVNKNKIVTQLNDENISSNYHPQILLFITLICGYYVGIEKIIVNLIENINYNTNIILDGTSLLIHITLQSCLIRLNIKKKNCMKDISSFLILANFSLWIIEITSIASTLSGSHYIPAKIFSYVLLALNRFYSGLIFIYFRNEKY